MENAFLDIVEEHQSIIHKVCGVYRDSMEDREDLFQEIVFQLWKAYPAYEEKSKVSTWMYRIALNTAMATFRKKQVQVDFRDQLPTNQVQVNSEASEKEEQLYSAIRQLNDAEKAIISLFFEGYNHREIGEITGISENYVGVRMDRIKKKLKRILSQ